MSTAHARTTDPHPAAVTSCPDHDTTCPACTPQED